MGVITRAISLGADALVLGITLWKTSHIFHVDKETREKLNEDFGKPMLILAGLTEGGEETEGMLSAMGLPEGTDPLQAIMQMPEEARDQMTSAMEEQIGEMPESIVTQAAVSFVGAEYEAIGEDVDAIQMDYIIIPKYLRNFTLILLNKGFFQIKNHLI